MLASLAPSSLTVGSFFRVQERQKQAQFMLAWQAPFFLPVKGQLYIFDSAQDRIDWIFQASNIPKWGLTLL